MKTALNLLLGQDHYEAEPEESPSLDNEQTRQWQQWFELAAESRDPLPRLGWFERIIADANLLFDEAFWQAHAGHGWQVPEARPLIAARAGRADCLLRLGQLGQARDEYLALLALCRADEPACRHPSPPSMPGKGSGMPCNNCWCALMKPPAGCSTTRP